MSARDLSDERLLTAVAAMHDARDPMPDGLAERAKAALAEAAPVRFEFPAGYSPSATHTLWECGANARHNRYVKASITRQIREDVVKLANNQRTPHFTGPVTILVVQHPPKGRRGLDSENVAPLGKAAIDGLRDAGVLINDTSKWVPTVAYTTGERVDRGQLVLLITPVGQAT